MAKSMTGYGAADASVAGGQLRVEIRSVNHRHLNLQFKLPAELQPAEGAIRDRLRDRLSRGSVTLSARWIVEPLYPDSIRVNLERARQMAQAARQLKQALDLPGEIDLAWLVRQPDVMAFAPQEHRIDQADVMPAVDAAMEALLAMRSMEGAALEGELRRLLDTLEGKLRTVEERAPQRLQAERERLRQAIADLMEGRALDERRLEQEIALTVDRLDIREECVRLGAHINAARSALTGEGSVGRPLGFLGQEMLREINTIGSKANDALIAQAVIAMKGVVEQFREQVENLE